MAGAQLIGPDAADQLRRLAGVWLGAALRVPTRTPGESQPILRGCELLSFGGEGPPILVIPAPIKRSYIWDLLPEASAVRRLLEHGFAVHMLRWTEGTVAVGAGLDFFAASAPAEAFRRLPVKGAQGPVILAGHSLGGLFAAMAACLFPDRVAGLVMVESPLVFSGHRLGMAARSGPLLRQFLDRRLTGAALTQLSVALMPDEFLWRRWQDGALAAFDPRRLRLHLGVLRWALDEFPLPAPLVGDLLAAIADDSFIEGRLRLRGQTIGPSDLRSPVLAVSVRSALTPPGTITPFLARCQHAPVRLIQFPIEAGTALAHVSPLVGPEAQTRLWPEVAAWASRVGGKG